MAVSKSAGALRSLLTGAGWEDVPNQWLIGLRGSTKSLVDEEM